MTETLVEAEQVPAQAEADDFWLAHAWNEESLAVLEQAFQEWNPNQPSLFIAAWAEFVDCAANLNPAWLPSNEYALAVARLAYAKQNQVSKADAEAVATKDLVKEGWLPLTVADFDPEWEDCLEEFPYLGSHSTFALLNPTLTPGAILKIVNRKYGASFLLNHATSFMWLNAAKHPNTPTSVLMRLAFRMVPSYSSYYRTRITDPSFRVAQIENRIDTMFTTDYLLPAPSRINKAKANSGKVHNSTLKWERDMDKKIAAALLSREDLPWAARKFLEFKGYKKNLPEKCSNKFSPAFAQAYVASLWSEWQWRTAPHYHVDAIPDPARGSLFEGRVHGAVLAPLVPGSSGLAKYLTGYTCDWLTPESRDRLDSVSYKTFPYLGGLLALIRNRATDTGFENAENIPLEWLLELNPLVKRADILAFIETTPGGTPAGTEKGRQAASDLMKQYESQIVNTNRIAHSPGYDPEALTLADIAGEYFYGAIKLSKEDSTRHA